MPKDLCFPISPGNILRKRQALKRELLTQSRLLPVKIAILGGSTTADVKSMLELFLLAHGIEPSFYESAFSAYYEEVMFESLDLWKFKPDIVFVHTNWRNVSQFPEVLASDSEVDQLVQREANRFAGFWDKIHTGLGALTIQNNFDLPRFRPLGNLDSSAGFGKVRFLQRMNEEFVRYAKTHVRFLINDIFYLSAQVGLAEWSDYQYWYSYHMAVSPLAAVAIAKSVASLIKSVYGKARKCLVLDLDNTLWGGVIGDDGVQNIMLGRDNPLGEAYSAFQHSVKDLQRRGILLAVCSKNDLENAKEGFTHPDSILKVSDFSSFKANWKPKFENIREIASELNIGLDSLVFVDDNPAEREIVSAQLPTVAVPDVGSDVSVFAEILEHEGYFEPVKIVQDDLERAVYYHGNQQRAASEATFATYGDFLASLNMTAEIRPFAPVYLERITQLINKSNQFNLTTRRYTVAEVESISRDRQYVTLYGRLADKFGDNGLVSVIIASIQGDTAEVDLWLMSCRVLKREMENSMFDALVESCMKRGIPKIVGVYIPSKKNGMVAKHYAGLGFTLVEDGPERSRWLYTVPLLYLPMTRHIRVDSQRLSQPSHLTAGTSGNEHPVLILNGAIS
jgi:FkbH-like protein